MAPFYCYEYKNYLFFTMRHNNVDPDKDKVVLHPKTRNYYVGRFVPIRVNTTVTIIEKHITFCFTYIKSGYIIYMRKV